MERRRGDSSPRCPIARSAEFGASANGPGIVPPRRADLPPLAYLSSFSFSPVGFRQLRVLRRPAGLAPFLRFELPLEFLSLLILAQRARAAAASLARVAGETPLRERGVVIRPVPPLRLPIMDARRCSRESICRRIVMASSRSLTDMSMGCPIPTRQTIAMNFL